MAAEANEANWRDELAHWLTDSLRRFVRIGMVTRKITSENSPIRFKSSRFDPFRAANGGKAVVE
jgi:hypothetical protein